MLLFLLWSWIKKKDLLLLLVNKFLFFEFIMYLENKEIILNKVEKKVIID